MKQCPQCGKEVPFLTEYRICAECHRRIEKNADTAYVVILAVAALGSTFMVSYYLSVLVNQMR